MSEALFLFSKNRIEKIFNIDIEKFLSDEIFFNRNCLKLDEYECYLGNINCIDDKICGWDTVQDFNKNTIYINCSNPFEKKIKFYDSKILINILEKIKDKMIELGFQDESKFEIYINYGNDHTLFKNIEDYRFPYYKNLTQCLNFLKELGEDKIILMSI